MQEQTVDSAEVLAKAKMILRRSIMIGVVAGFMILILSGNFAGGLFLGIFFGCFICLFANMLQCIYHQLPAKFYATSSSRDLDPFWAHHPSNPGSITYQLQSSESERISRSLRGDY